MRLLELVYVVLVTKRFRCTASDAFGSVYTVRILGRVKGVHLRPQRNYLDDRHTTHLILELAAHLQTEKENNILSTSKVITSTEQLRASN